jgi:proline dehydrogenase
MMRSALLRITDNALVRGMASGGLGRRVSSRFVAGEELDDAMNVMKALREKGLMTSLDHLGEHVTDLAAAHAAADAYVAALDRVEALDMNADTNIAVKLSQLGLDVDREAAVKNAERVVERAATSGATVTFDMEDHRFTERTVEICLEMHQRHPSTVGLAVQAYLLRTPSDLERVLGVQVRLCKGAYLEPPTVAFPDKADVDASYVRCMEKLLLKGNYPGLATHDERIIAHARRFAKLQDVGTERFEFQMLYGVRRDLQEDLRRAGYHMRVYIPFGTQWYPYLMRRLAERPANIAFMLGNVVKETVPGL